jgi:hypothetical protein
MTGFGMSCGLRRPSATAPWLKCASDNRETLGALAFSWSFRSAGEKPANLSGLVALTMFLSWLRVSVFALRLDSDPDMPGNHRLQKR